MESLGIYERSILCVLRDQKLSTKEIAASFASPFNRTQREHSFDVRSWLLDMAKRGLIIQAREKRGSSWCATDAGIVAINGKRPQARP